MGGHLQQQFKAKKQKIVPLLTFLLDNLRHPHVHVHRQRRLLRLLQDTFAMLLFLLPVVAEPQQQQQQQQRHADCEGRWQQQCRARPHVLRGFFSDCR